MNKRLRKKRKCGKFTEYGFTADITLRPAASTRAFFDELTAFFERQDGRLMFGGSLTGLLVTRCSGCHEHKWSALTEADQQAVRAWLEGHPEVEHAELSELFDINRESS